jgi:putative ABC transport system substrate-binding protein
MDRREFIRLGGAVAASAPWSFPVRAQPSAVPLIGFMSSRGATDAASLVAAFQRGLSDTGFEEGRTVRTEFRWAEGHYDRLPALAADLVAHKVALLMAAGGIVSARAAKAATATIPVVFVSAGDPVAFGLVASLSRPGGNVTGASLINVSLGAKRLELLRELLPAARSIAMLVNPDTPDSTPESHDVLAAARVLGREISIVQARVENEFEPAFAAVRQARAGALIVGADPFFTSQRAQLVALATRHAVPTIYYWRDFVEAGGLLSYGTSLADGYRQAGIYAGRVLKGAKPADLPVVQPTKFELVINLKTAKALGLEVSPTLLAIADEVIE